MKSTFAIWGLVFLLSFFTAGFFPAVFITALAAAGSVSMGLHAHELGSGSSYKSLR
jgi:hypothetical protein